MYLTDLIARSWGGVAVRSSAIGLALVSAAPVTAQQFPTANGTITDISLQECFEALEKGNVLLSVVRGQISNIDIWYDNKLFTIAFEPDKLICVALKY